MARKKWFRAMKMIVLVIACISGVVAAIVYVKLWPTPGTVQLLAKSREVAQAEQDTQRLLVEQARAKIPESAGKVRDWTYDEGAKALGEQLGFLRPDLVLSLAEALLSDDPDVKKGDLGTLKARIDHARQQGSITPVEESLDLSRHSREEVLAAIDAYLSALPLGEAEAAYECGVFGVRKRVPGDQGRLRCRPEKCVAYRGVFEARRGDVEKALRSYLCFAGMCRALRESAGGLFWMADLWPLERIADFAWRDKPFTPEQREQVLASVSHPVPRERLLESLYADVDAKRQFRDETVAEVRKQPLGTLGAFIFDYTWNREIRKVEEHMRQLPSILEQPPAVAVPEMDRIYDSEASRDQSYGIGAGTILSRAATLHLDNARAGTIRDAVRIAFVLKDYKRAHGEYPKDLAALAPGTSMPPDPLDGKPLSYESDGKAFTVAFPKRGQEGGSVPGRVRAGTADRGHRILTEASTDVRVWHAQE